MNNANIITSKLNVTRNSALYCRILITYLTVISQNLPLTTGTSLYFLPFKWCHSSPSRALHSACSQTVYVVYGSRLSTRSASHSPLSNYAAIILLRNYGTHSCKTYFSVMIHFNSTRYSLSLWYLPSQVCTVNSCGKPNSEQLNP